MFKRKDKKKIKNKNFQNKNKNEAENGEKLRTARLKSKFTGSHIKKRVYYVNNNKNIKKKY